MKKDWYERTLLLRAKVGSENYNLNTKTSDEDFKEYISPSFDDLYKGERFAKSTVGSIDVTVHDIRELVNQLYKSNVNFVEVLFSVDLSVFDEDLQKLIDLRDEIAIMNLAYLYRSCKGMYYNKLQIIEKGTEPTKYLVEEFGYDTKQFMSAYRILDFIKRFSDTDFKDFKKAIWYEGEEREYLLSMKHGKFTKEEALKILEDKYNEYLSFAGVYSVPENENTKEKMKEIIYKVVKKNSIKS